MTLCLSASVCVGLSGRLIQHGGPRQPSSHSDEKERLFLPMKVLGLTLTNVDLFVCQNLNPSL